jgi:Hpt domain
VQTMKQDVGPLHPPESPDKAAHPAAAVAFDRDGLQRLLQIVGPMRADDFLIQFQADLDAALATLQASIKTHDLVELRRATHNIVALAGTFVATDLAEAARALNTMAHRGDVTGISALVATVSTFATQLSTEITTFRGHAGHAIKGPQA